MKRAFKYRIYPTKAQVAKLEMWLNVCRELYNAAIQERRDAWKISRTSIGFNAQSDQLPEIKRERPDVAEVYSQALQNVLHRVDTAFQHFFRRVKLDQTPGYPRFKSDDRYDSLTWPQKKSFALIGTKRLSLGNFGKIKIKLHRPVDGIQKTCTVKRVAGRWYAIFSCDKISARVYPEATAEVGIDLGLTNFATLSTGEKIDNPRWYRKTEERLARAQRTLSRKKRGSKRQAKAKRNLARLRAKEKNQRNDFQHKLAHRIILKNAAISVEDLPVKEMIKQSSTGLSKSIQDAAWSTFLSILEAKAEEAARRFVRVPPCGTSNTCSHCGTFSQKALLERLHKCPCGLVLDRDINASINILRLGRSLQAAS